MPKTGRRRNNHAMLLIRTSPPPNSTVGRTIPYRNDDSTTNCSACAFPVKYGSDDDAGLAMLRCTIPRAPASTAASTKVAGVPNGSVERDVSTRKPNPICVVEDVHTAQAGNERT